MRLQQQKQQQNSRGHTQQLQQLEDARQQPSSSSSSALVSTIIVKNSGYTRAARILGNTATSQEYRKVFRHVLEAARGQRVEEAWARLQSICGGSRRL